MEPEPKSNNLARTKNVSESTIQKSYPARSEAAAVACSPSGAGTGPGCSQSLPEPVQWNGRPPGTSRVDDDQRTDTQLINQSINQHAISISDVRQFAIIN